MSFRRRWYGYWFAPSSLLNLAVCRVAIHWAVAHRRADNAGV